MVKELRQRFSKNGTTRFGLLTNHASVSQEGVPMAQCFIANGLNLVKLYAPEHGVLAQAEDGQAQSNQTDLLTHLSVVSLYGDKLSPAKSDLEDVDIVIIDLPNIGCRFYTYWWTISYMLEACSKLEKEILIIDRPNLRVGCSTEGPMLDEVHCQSFLGRWTMPLAHPFSYWQLATYFNQVRNLKLSLHRIAGPQEVSFIPPSPAISDQQTVWLYPAIGVFEGLNVSVGRGTSSPFRVIGAPWIDPMTMLHYVQELKPPGLVAGVYSFKPMWSVYEAAYCHGLYFTVADPKLFQPVQFSCDLIHFLRNTYGAQLKPATYPTAANPTGQRHLDLLLGIPQAWKKINSDIEEVQSLIKHESVQRWKAAVECM